MPTPVYSSVPTNEDFKKPRQLRLPAHTLSPLRNSSLFIFSSVLTVSLICFAVGIQVGKGWDGWTSKSEKAPWDIERKDGLLDPQGIIGEIPAKGVMFKFPSEYEDDGIEGDRIWNELMPLGAGFLRVPHPRQYALPRSKKVVDDVEEAEIYSVSMTHQLHCLAVIRDVVIKYAKGDKSRFAGAGHEHHCLDYIRQAILCTGDTTLDHAEIQYNPDGSERRYGFTGDKATHRCRDWDAIKEVLVAKRLDNKTGILF